jgi:integrase
VEWRKSHRITVRRELDSLISRFGEKAVGQITKADVLAYRAELGKVTARGKETKLSAARINKMLNPLRQILNEAADRFNFPTPCQNIKQLRIKRTDVDPFSLEDVRPSSPRCARISATTSPCASSPGCAPERWMG